MFLDALKEASGILQKNFKAFSLYLMMFLGGFKSCFGREVSNIFQEFKSVSTRISPFDRDLWSFQGNLKWFLGGFQCISRSFKGFHVVSGHLEVISGGL